MDRPAALAIRALNWSRVPRHLTLSWASGDGVCLATWPEPVDHDECFKKAGFDRFADTDARWDAEFSAIIRAMVQYLGRYGSPAVREGTRPVRAGLLARLASWLEREPATLSDWLVGPTNDDNFRPCVVDFGAPAAATMRTADGHPILWLQLPSGAGADLPSLLEAVAGTRTVREMNLDWQVLA